MDDAAVELAHRMFDLARDGAAELLGRGADPNRTNDRGQTAVAAALFARSPGSVTALLEAGADPHHGTPSAGATVEYFDLPDMRAVLERTLDK